MTTTRTVLITGASAGIGAAFARHAASEGCDLLLVARRETRLRDLADDLSRTHGIRSEIFAVDLADPDAPGKIVDFVAANDLTIDVLINNAGLSRNTTFADTSWSDLGAEIQIMVTAITELASSVIPGMRQRRWGRIINVSSIAALLPPAPGLLYTAIKRYGFDLSQSLDMELKPHGIHVTALCPGFTHTEFHDVMGTREAAQDIPAFLWSKPETVARAGWKAVMAGNPICVPGIANKILAATTRPVPLRFHPRLAKAFDPFQP